MYYEENIMTSENPKQFAFNFEEEKQPHEMTREELVAQYTASVGVPPVVGASDEVLLDGARSPEDERERRRQEEQEEDKEDLRKTYRK